MLFRPGDKVLVVFENHDCLHKGTVRTASRSSGYEIVSSHPEGLTITEWFPEDEVSERLSLPKAPADKNSLPALKIDDIVYAWRERTRRWLPAVITMPPPVNPKKPQVYKLMDLCFEHELTLQIHDLRRMYDGDAMELDHDKRAIWPRCAEDDRTDAEQDAERQAEKAAKRSREQTKALEILQSRLGPAFDRSNKLTGLHRSTSSSAGTIKWLDALRSSYNPGSNPRSLIAPLPSMKQHREIDVRGVIDIVNTGKEELAFWREGSSAMTASVTPILLRDVKSILIGTSKKVTSVWLRFEGFDGRHREYGMPGDMLPALLSVAKMCFRAKLSERDGKTKEAQSDSHNSQQAVISSSGARESRKRKRSAHHKDCLGCGAPLPAGRGKKGYCKDWKVCKRCGDMKLSLQEEAAGICGTLIFAWAFMVKAVPPD